MPGTALLRIYLRDHHATAVAGTELAKRAAKSNQDTSFGPLLEELRGETLADLQAFEDIMSRLGVTPARGKDGALWAAEKIGRLKLNGSLTGYSPLSRVIELEGLVLSAQGNRVMWRALLQLADARLDEDELKVLENRAEDHSRRLQEAHLEAVRIAFAAGTSENVT